MISKVDFDRVVEDLTDYQIELERQNVELRLAKQQLEQSILEKSRLAEKRSSQLHELTVQLAKVEQLERKRLADILHDHLQQLLVAAKFSLGRLSQNIRDRKTKSLLEQADSFLNDSIEASRSLTVELSPPILRDAGLGAALEWLGRWMKEKNGLKVNLDIQSEASASEEINFFLFQSTRELLLNVLKHAKVDRVGLCMRYEKERIAIVIEDKGVGFDPASIKSDKKNLRGIGLFNIQKRLEMLGGKFDIKSQIGKGCCFSLEVPWTNVADKNEMPYAVAPVPPGRPDLIVKEKLNETICVLVADDHKIVRQGLINVLETQSDISVVGEAEDGEEAIRLAHALDPDVIIMDVTMPKLNGIEATRVIKRQKSSVKIIGLSFHEADEMTERMIHAGADFYLSKSGPADVLIQTIRKASGPRPHKNLQGTLPLSEAE